MYIPAAIRQKALPFSKGKYIVNPQYPDQELITNWIKALKFEQFELPDYSLGKRSRKRNSLYSFFLPELNNEVVLKVSQISNKYSWYRRLNLIITRLFKDYNLCAYYGGIGLQCIGIRSAHMLAYWTCKQKFNTKSYILYEKIHAQMSVFELCNKLNQENLNAKDIISAIAAKHAKIIRKIHSHNMRHGDVHAGNFLVNFSDIKVKDMTKETVSKMKFTLIDLDKFQFVRYRTSWLKHIYDLRCLRRFIIDDINGTKALEYYLEKPPTLFQKNIVKFWMKGGFNIYKWIKPTKKTN